MTTGSLGQYAKHRSVSPAFITKLRNAQRLVYVKNEGRDVVVDFEASDRLVAETTSPAHVNGALNSPPRSAKRLAEAAAADAAVLNGDEEEDDPPAASPSSTPGKPPAPAPETNSIYRRAQTQQKVYDARLSELAYRREIGELLDRTTVERTVFDLFRSLRDQAFQAPQRAALRVIGQLDPRAIETVIEDELRKAFDTWETKASSRLAPPAKGRAS